MKCTDRILSLSILGVLLFAFAPAANAQFFGGDDNGQRGRGRGFGQRQEFRQSIPQDVREDLRACRENNEEHEDRKACADAIFEANGIEKPEHHGRRGRGHKKEFFQGLPEDVQDDLRQCREDHEDREDRKACADAILEANGIEKPERPERPQISEEVREELRSCREENEGDREAARACAEQVFEQNGIERPGRAIRSGLRNRVRRASANLPDEVVQEILECRELDGFATRAQCVRGVLSEYRADQ